MSAAAEAYRRLRANLQFARPDDPLAQAQDAGTLHRNFQGYSTRAEAEIVAFGVSGIHQFEGAYAQNVKTLPAYYDRLDEGRLLRRRGLNGCTVIDDCYNANPQSVKAALDLLESRGGARKVAVLGTMLELGEASERLPDRAVVCDHRGNIISFNLDKAKTT